MPNIKVSPWMRTYKGRETKRCLCGEQHATKGKHPENKAVEAKVRGWKLLKQHFGPALFAQNEKQLI